MTFRVENLYTRDGIRRSKRESPPLGKKKRILFLFFVLFFPFFTSSKKSPICFTEHEFHTCPKEKSIVFFPEYVEFHTCHPLRKKLTIKLAIRNYGGLGKHSGLYLKCY